MLQVQVQVPIFKTLTKPQGWITSEQPNHPGVQAGHICKGAWQGLGGHLLVDRAFALWFTLY